MRLARENPELSEQELHDLAMRGTPKRFKEGEPRYDFTCYKCGGEYRVSQETHDWIQSLKRTPKCADCYL
jgi:hypothetical protein